MLQTKEALVFQSPRTGRILELAGPAGHLVQPSNPRVTPEEPDTQRGEGFGEVAFPGGGRAGTSCHICLSAGCSLSCHLGPEAGQPGCE